MVQFKKFDLKKKWGIVFWFFFKIKFLKKKINPFIYDSIVLEKETALIIDAAVGGVAALF